MKLCEKNNGFILLIFLILLLSLYSCSSLDRDSIIKINNSDRLSVADNPANIIRYEEWTPELSALADSINKLSPSQISEFDSFSDDFDVSLSDAMINIDVERENGDLTMISVFTVSENAGAVRIVEHYANDTQTETAAFAFNDDKIVSQVKKLKSSLEK